MAGRDWLGEAGCGAARYGKAVQGTAGMVRLVRQGKVSFGKARRDMAGVEWRGGVMKGRDRSGMVGYGRRGMTWPGEVRQGGHGRERPGRERPGRERSGKAGLASSL